MNNPSTKPAENISLQDLTYPVKSALHQSSSFARHLQNNASKHSTLFIIILIAGIGISFFHYMSESKKTEVKILVSNTVSTRKTFAEIIENLNADPPVGWSELGFTDVRTELTNGTKVKSDTSTNANLPFLIIVRLSIAENGQRLADSVIQRVNNNAYLRSLCDVTIKNTVNTLSKIEQDIKSIDSLKLGINRSLLSAESMSYFRNESDPSQIYRASQELYIQRNTAILKTSLEANPLQVIDVSRSNSSRVPLLFSILGPAVLYSLLIAILITSLLGFFTTKATDLHN